MTLEILANAAVRMLVVGAATWLMLRLVRVRNAHVELLVWRMWLLASLALPALLYWQIAPSFTTSFHLPVIAADGADAVQEAVPATSGWAWMRILLAIYLAGASLLILRLIAGLAAMWVISRASSRMATAGDVRISARITSPATFGTVILLPRDAREWPAGKLAAVLLHERSHVRGRDGYWSWLARFHAAVFWFNPFAWWLTRRLEALAEITSDDAVVSARHDPLAYAALLLEFARQPGSRSAVMSVADSNVPGRIERLLARTPPGAELPRVTRWLALIALIPGIFLAASTTRALAQSSASPESAAATAAAGDTPPSAPGSAAQSPSSAPRIGVRMKAAANPDAFYPDAAKQARVTGSVLVSVDVDPQGQVVDVKVLEPLPADDPFGFGPAAVEVARRSQYSNPFPVVSNLRFKVKFALTPDPPSRPPTAKLGTAADPELFYPPSSKLRLEQGAPIVQACVGADGRLLGDPVVIESSGSADLDHAAIEVAKNSRYTAATEGGKVLKQSCLKFKVKFALTADPPVAPKT
jgi:TonB family protein